MGTPPPLCAARTTATSLDMTYTEHRDAESFLSVAREPLERHESANGLMLGICLRLAGDPGAYGDRPYLATVESAAGLRIAAVMTPPPTSS